MPVSGALSRMLLARPPPIMLQWLPAPMLLVAPPAITVPNRPGARELFVLPPSTLGCPEPLSSHRIARVLFTRSSRGWLSAVPRKFPAAVPRLPPRLQDGPFEPGGVVAEIVIVLPTVVSATLAPAWSVTASLRLLMPFTTSPGVIFAAVTALAASAALLMDPVAAPPASVANTA